MFNFQGCINKILCNYADMYNLNTFDMIFKNILVFCIRPSITNNSVDSEYDRNSF